MSENKKNDVPSGKPKISIEEARKKLITQISKKAEHELKANPEPTHDQGDKGNFIKKILVVDDAETTVALMNKYLLALDFTVRTALSAKEGMEILTKEEIDLVITDINMPGMNGIDFFLWIKKNKPECHIIIMTAFGSEELKEFASQKGALRYFEKPMNISQLKKVITELNESKKDKSNIVEINLFDFVRMNILLHKQKRLLIKDPVTDLVAQIYLADGEIIHAECENLKGLKAFYCLVSMKKGEFSEAAWSAPPEKTIDAKPLGLFNDSINLIRENEHEITNIMFFAKQLNNPPAGEIMPKGPGTGFHIEESGITIGKTTRKEVIDIMKNYGCIDYPDQINKPLFTYDHLSLSIRFDLMGHVQELNFGKQYRGRVVKGISIGDKVSRVAREFGAPNFSSEKGALWDKIAVLRNPANEIEYIRLT